MTKKEKIILIGFIAWFGFLIFAFILSASQASAQLVTCGEKFNAQGVLVGTGCTLCDALVVIQNIINFLIGPTGIIYALAILMIAYGGFRFLISGGSEDKRREAKGIISAAIVGVIIGLSSFLIVGTVINVIGEGASNQPAGFPWPWNEIECSVVPGGQFVGGDLITYEPPPAPVAGVSCTPETANCSGTVEINGVPVKPGVRPFAQEGLARSIEKAYSLASLFRLTEGCPPNTSHLSFSHCSGGSVDIGMAEGIAKTPSNIALVCLALKSSGFQPSDIVNEYSQTCTTGECASACGFPSSFPTTTGEHLHIKAPGRVFQCKIDKARFTFLPSGTQQDGWYSQGSPPRVNVAINGNTACAGQDFLVSLRAFGGGTVSVLNERRVTWQSGASGFTVKLRAGEELCSGFANPDCQYFVRVKFAGVLGNIDSEEPSGVLRYDCDGICDFFGENWSFDGIDFYP